METKILTLENACQEGKKFAEGFSTLREAWDKCERGDWMLWFAQKNKVDIRPLTLAKGLCANTVRHLMKDERNIKAVDAAIAFGKGEISREELNADDAYATAYAYAKRKNQKQTADICREILTQYLF